VNTHKHKKEHDGVRSPRGFGRTYDQFFASKSRVVGVQFWGLILLGGSLLLLAATLMVRALGYVSRSRLGIGEVILLFVILAIAGPIAAFGMLHIRRAFAGRR
jgi:hypothetical protein